MLLPFSVDLKLHMPQTVHILRGINGITTTIFRPPLNKLGCLSGIRIQFYEPLMLRHLGCEMSLQLRGLLTEGQLHQ